MIRAPWRRLLFVGAAGIVLAGSLAAPFDVEAASRRPTSLDLTGPASVLLTERIPLKVSLHDSGGRPIADALITLAVDGTAEGRRRTDSTGSAAFSITRTIPVGSHTLAVAFAGDSRYTGSRASIRVSIERPVLTVRTLPAAPGVVFSYRGSRFAAGADGIARLDLDKPAGETELPDVISLPSSTTSRIEFAKWAGKPPDLTATFDLYYAVQLTFVDRLGNAVDPATISRLVIRSSIGQVIEQERIEPVWVHGVRVVSLAGGLEVKDILYGIDEVTVDAANVVNRASQRFAPRETQDWKVELLFYRTSIQLTDVLFGFPISTTVRIESPSGRISRVSSDEKGIVALQPLPRGTYRVTPEHVGLTVTRPVTMSRDSDVHLAVITYLDMAVAAGVPIGIAIVLLLIGRPRILSRLKWRRRQGEAIP